MKFEIKALDYINNINKEGNELITSIHPKDEMYFFFTTHPLHLDMPAYSYFISGESMIQSLNKILEISGNSGGLLDVNSFLEFACGFGRFTRHLIRHIDPLKITVSDVYRDAVDFQKETFMVDGFYSSFDPESVLIAKKYEVIFVASLFSHLPHKTWMPWLKMLYDSLSHDGLLIFSTHSEACMADPTLMPASGFLYLNMSESNSHSFDDYGTTYVTNEFVTNAITKEIGEIALRFPKELWGYQDVYSIRKTKNN